MNYVIFIPGILLFVISLGAALSIAQRGGSSAPRWITLAAALILGAIGVALR